MIGTRAGLRALLFAVGGCSVMVVPSLGWAQTPPSSPPASSPTESTSTESPEVRAIIEGGVKLREEGRDQDALREFKKAYDMSKSARALAQMAIAEQALGQWVAADRDLHAALVTKGDPWIDLHRATLNDALATIGRRLGTLEVIGGVNGAELYIDGLKVGVLPLKEPIRLLVGTPTLEVRAQGYYTVSRAIAISPGVFTRESVELATRPHNSDGSVAPDGGRQADGDSADATSAGASRQKTLGIIALAGAGVFALGGLAAHGARQSVIHSYNDNAACPGDTMPNQPAECQDKLDAGSTWKTVEYVGFIGGGVLAATGLALLLTTPKAKPQAARALNFTVGFDRQSAGLRCSGSF